MPAQRLVPFRITCPASAPATRSTEVRAGRTSASVPLVSWHTSHLSFRPACWPTRASRPLRPPEASSHSSCSPALSRSSRRCRHPVRRPLLFSPRVSGIASVVRSFPPPRTSLRARSGSRSIGPEGFRCCQACRARVVFVPQSDNRRRSNPGVQRTRYARR